MSATQKTVLFEEVQPSGRKSLRDFFRVTTVLFVVALILNLILRKGSVEAYTLFLMFGTLLYLVLGQVLYSRLVLQVRTDGIYVRFPPLQPSFTAYRWTELRDVHIRRFDVFLEYGGPGIRRGPMGKAYILSGHTGLQLTLNNGSRVLISTCNPEQLQLILQSLGK